MRPDPQLISDADLIAAVRDGETEAYGVLYERHLHAAQRAAACLARSAAEREDLVADAFARVLRALRDGGGPREEFRAYLLVTMRNAAVSMSRGATVSSYADVPEAYLPHPNTGDPLVNRWNAMTVASAFATLPARWRTVLWHTEVEEETPAEVAPLLGMRPNGVAALAYRAREGLRQAYLRAHLSEVQSRECRATVSKLAGWVRHSVPMPLGRKISRHLAVCSDCRDRADTLSRVNEELRASLAPVVLGGAFAAAYAPVTAAVAPVAGAVKSVLAKVGVAAAIAATAVTVGASGPNLAIRESDTGPVAIEPEQRTDSIEGPSTGGGSTPRMPADTGTPTTTTGTLPATPDPNGETPPPEGDNGNPNGNNGTAGNANGADNGNGNANGAGNGNANGNNGNGNGNNGNGNGNNGNGNNGNGNGNGNGARNGNGNANGKANDAGNSNPNTNPNANANPNVNPKWAPNAYGNADATTWADR